MSVTKNRSHLNQMMGGIGTGLAAQMANALVAHDDRRRQLAPCLLAVASINAIASYSLLANPAERAMNRRFPRHVLSPPFLSRRNVIVETAFLESG
jgi:hypothetical protein